MSEKNPKIKIGNNFVPPVLQQVSKLAAGVASVGTGSATGNPRNKHALQPGHSLMDWIRLGSSGRDLTGAGERAGKLSITPSELAKHDKKSDAWLAIRGKVYNVTHYLPFHPGGPDELMKGTGKDATNLFDEVHAWVNYDSILAKCYLGRLVMVDPKVDREELFFGREKNVRIQSPVKVEALPRFDWIQKTDYITIIFYTGAFSNPQVEITRPDDENILRVFLTYNNQIFDNELKFHSGIQWPCQAKINYETGKVQVNFRKLKSRIWENYGVLKQKSADISTEQLKPKFLHRIKNKMKISHNTFLIEFENCDLSKLIVPLGKHVRVFGNVKGEELARSYTPVPNCLFGDFGPQPATTDDICLMIKSYPSGNISRFVCNKRDGDLVEISKPVGTFRLKDLENRETFLLIAAGTGITPMLGITIFLLERRVRKCHKVALLFFNRTEDDILFRHQLEALQENNERFKVEHVLSHAGSKWTGARGQISNRILEEAVERHLSDGVYKKSDIFSLICGPVVFTNLAQTILEQLQFGNDQIHLFLG